MSKVIQVVNGMVQLNLGPGSLTAEPLNLKLIIRWLLGTRRFTKPFSKLPRLPTIGRGKRRN